MPKRFTEEIKQYIIEKSPYCNDKEIGEALGLTPHQVTHFRWYHNINSKYGKHKWTQEEGKFIRDNYQKLTDGQMAEKLGLKSTTILSYRKTHHLEKRQRRHKPGHIMMQKGPSGKYYKWIKLEDGRWVAYHRHLYQKHYGPIPGDKVLTFKDGDSLNTSLSNLKLTSKRAILLSNQDHEKSGKTLKAVWAKQKRRLAMGLSPVNRLGLHWREKKPHVKSINTDPAHFNHFSDFKD